MTTSPSALTAAQLQVVQPGSRANFRRRVMDAMRSVVPSAAAFFCFGKDDSRAYADSSRVVDGALHSVKSAGATKLTQAFGFETKSVVETTRRVYMTMELYPDEERKKLPYFRDNSLADALARSMIVFLHEGGVLFGVCGLERRADEPEFTMKDAAQVEALAPFVVAAARAQMAYDELTKEAAALRSLAKIGGTLFVVDRDKKRVVWAANREHGVDWAEDVDPFAELIVDAAESQLAARARGDALPTPPRIGEGTVVGVARIEGDPVFGAA